MLINFALHMYIIICKLIIYSLEYVFLPPFSVDLIGFVSFLLLCGLMKNVIQVMYSKYYMYSVVHM